MFSAKRIAALVAALLAGVFLFFASIAWFQQTAWDAGIFLGAMQTEQGDWVADVGSGEGKYSVEMGEAVGDGGHVFAVDIDDGALRELNKKIEKQGVRNVTSVYSAYDNPMLPRRSFEAVLVRNTYHEFTAHERMLERIRAALKPGGRLVLAEFINEDMIDEDRETQIENHKLAMRHAREELRDARFTIAEEVENVYSQRSGDYRTHPLIWLWRGLSENRMWMIVATPTADNPDG